MLIFLRKTRIALEYASGHEESDTVSVFWVHASTAERMEKAYRDIAKEAGLVEAEDPKVNQLRLVKQWLERKESGKWVMVIDNADDENLFYGEDEHRGQEPFNSSKKLAQYFPRSSNGSILLTTRNRVLGVKFATVHGVITISEMSISESKSLFVENLEERDHDDQDLTDLVEILENLPLALVQAAAFIEERSQLIGDYLQMYRGSDSSKIKLLSQNFEDDERDPDSKNPVAVTWAISFDQIRKNNPLAAELLSLMSVLDRQGVPKSLLSPDKEEVELEKALGTLKAFSLITPDEKSQAFTIHRLVYLATRNWLRINEELDSWTGKAVVLLSELFPEETYENPETRMKYLPHAQTILNSDKLPASENIAEATLLFSVSRALGEKGDYDAAEMMARKSLNLREKALGKNDLETLSSLANLALVFWRQGKNVKAEEIYRQVLNNYEEMLGNEHLDTLMIVNDMGLVLRGQGKLEVAKEMYRRALSAYEKILGKVHPNTLTSLNNLGLVLQDQSKYEEAETLHRRALGAREKILGKEHPDTLTSLSNLGLVLTYQYKYKEAEELHRRALGAREEILGKEHPNTLTSLNNLGLVLQDQSKYEEAETLHRRALGAREKILGKEHPDTLTSLSNLGLVLTYQYKYKEAEELHRRALGAREEILGKEHPDTLTSLINLGSILQLQDRFEEAAIIFQRALIGREKALGLGHPDTIFSVWKLADLFHDRRQYQDALPLYQRACAGFEKTLGSDHPDTQICAKNYSIMVEEMRDSEMENASVIEADP